MMSITAELADSRVKSNVAQRTVVAVVVEWRAKIALLKRSHDLHHDGGRWHCVTGYVEPGATPQEQALRELQEETGLEPEDLVGLHAGTTLLLPDSSGAPWLVHTFTAVTSRRRLTLDWEHETYRWTSPEKTPRFANRVSWLDTVLEATGHYTR